MTLTEKEKKEMMEKEVQKEIDNLWKIINWSIKGSIYIILAILVYLTIDYTIKGFLYGFI